jgi:hypothetical protein|tara:strand:- start:1151 stop:1306 length:156 start_codon:yes stop_codon:yes gene_type:complete
MGRLDPPIAIFFKKPGFAVIEVCFKLARFYTISEKYRTMDSASLLIMPIDT